MSDDPQWTGNDDTPLLAGQEPPRSRYHGFAEAGPRGPALVRVQDATLEELEEEHRAIARLHAHVDDRAFQALRRATNERRTKWREAKRRQRARRREEA